MAEYTTLYPVQPDTAENFLLIRQSWKDQWSYVQLRDASGDVPHSGLCKTASRHTVYEDERHLRALEDYSKEGLEDGTVKESDGVYVTVKPAHH